MGGLSRLDRVLVVAVPVLLAALAGLGLAERVSPAAPRSPTPRPSGSPAVSGRGTVQLPGLPRLAAGFLAPAPETTPPTSPTTTGPPPGPVTAIGDSIILDAEPYLTADLPGVSVDGQVSRQFSAGIDVVRADRAAGSLGDVLVVELGTNGTVTASDFDAMMQAAAGVRRVVFVNVDVPRAWAAADDAVLVDGVARYPGIARLADWNALAGGHPEWFTADGVHLTPPGAQALAALITADA